MDNGPELTSRVLDQWAYDHGVQLRFIDPARPVQNGFIESFNGRFRDECLNQHWFVNLAHARRIVEAWRLDYNLARPHSSLGYLTPDEFAKKKPPPAKTLADLQALSGVVLLAGALGVALARLPRTS